MSKPLWKTFTVDGDNEVVDWWWGGGGGAEAEVVASRECGGSMTRRRPSPLSPVKPLNLPLTVHFGLGRWEAAVMYRGKISP